MTNQTVRQIAAVLALSLRRLGRSRLTIACAFLGALPVLVVCLILAHHTFRRSPVDIARVHDIFETWIRTFYLNFIVFFVASILGFGVVRQERDDRTLHYLFLQPVKRWALVLGKTAAFLTLASAICLASFWGAYLLMTLGRFGPRAAIADLFVEGRFVVLLRESGVLVLGLLAYGSIALLMGSLFKSGLYGLLLLAWETALPYLPSSMKMWTMMHYLQSLLPERPVESTRLFELLGDPAPVWLCILVLLAVPSFFVALCAVLFQWRECLYSEA
jgi:ABC-type transport system involved in multi-copper enzyme maturation permease subunit